MSNTAHTINIKRNERLPSVQAIEHVYSDQSQARQTAQRWEALGLVNVRVEEDGRAFSVCADVTDQQLATL